MKTRSNNLAAHSGTLFIILIAALLIVLPAYTSSNTKVALRTTAGESDFRGLAGSGALGAVGRATLALRESLRAKAGPSTVVPLGTEVFLHGQVQHQIRFLLFSVALDVSPNIVIWEFLPDSPNVGTLIDSHTLNPHFKAEQLGVYSLRMSGDATVTRLDGSRSTLAFQATARITVATTITDLSVCRIEVNQGIQEMDAGQSDLCAGSMAKDNAIDLVKGRSTLVRIYVGMTGVPDALLGGVTGRLRVFRDGQEVLPAPMMLIGNQKIEVQAPGPTADTRLDAFRASLPSSLNFLLNKNHTFGTIELRAEVNPGCKTSELNCANNETSTLVTFHGTRRLNLNWLTIHYERDGVDLRIKEEKFKQVGYLKRTYPLADDGICVAYHGPDLDVDYSLDGNGSAPILCDTRSFPLFLTWVCDSGWNRLINDIEDFVDCGKVFCNAPGSDPHFYGLIPSGTPGSAFIVGNGQTSKLGDPEPIAAGVEGCPPAGSPLQRPDVCSPMSPDFGGVVLAHELGHNYGFSHVDRIIGAFGFDFLTNTVVQPDRVDFMRAAVPDHGWISRQAYRALLGQFKSNSTPSCPIKSQVFQGLRAQTNQDDHLLVSGRVSPTGAILRPMYRVVRSGIPDHPNIGSYVVELSNEATGETLFRQLFEPIELDEPNPNGGAFRVYVPWQDGTTHIVIKRRGSGTAGDRVLAKAAVSPNPPSVRLTEPAAGTVASGKVTVKWTATDPDGDPLVTKLEYSNDGGQSWTPASGLLTGSQFDLDTSRLAGGKRAFLRAMVSDGTNTASSIAGPFSVADKAPRAFVLTSEQELEIDENTPLTLQGIATDFEDGPLSGGSLSWESDISGVLEFGSSLQTAQLSPGFHNITLKAVDSKGNVGTDTVGVSVLAAIPPLESFSLDIKAESDSGEPLTAEFKIREGSRLIDSKSPLTAGFDGGAWVHVEAAVETRADNRIFTFKHWLSDSLTLTDPVIELQINKGRKLTAVYQIGFKMTCPTDVGSFVARGSVSSPVFYDPPVFENELRNKTVACTPPSGSVFALATTIVTCMARDSANFSVICSFSITLVTEPFILFCPPKIEVLTATTIDTSAVVTYPAPKANEPTLASMDCSPPSGSAFPVGVTAVTCSATNSDGESAECSFPVSVIQLSDSTLCLQDDSNGNVFLFNPTTGAYIFTECNSGTTITGIGTVTRQDCTIFLRDVTDGQRVVAQVVKCLRKGLGTVQIIPSGRTVTILDRDTSDSVCSCP